MAGAHLDSWHTATGATDNADGTATVMEAMRIQGASTSGRGAPFAARCGGEEQGCLDRGPTWRNTWPATRTRRARQVLGGFNLDNGFPPISGFYMEGNDPARDHGRVAEAGREPGRHHAVARASAPPITCRSSTSACPASRRCRNTTPTTCARTTNVDFAATHRSECVEAGVDGDGGGAVSGGDARGDVPAAAREEVWNAVITNAITDVHTKDTEPTEDGFLNASAAQLVI